MVKRMLPLLLIPLLLSGCASTMTNLTPKTQVRNPEGLYPVEVSLATRQQTLRWDSIKPQIIVGKSVIPMRPTPLMTNRWEGLIPAPAGTSSVEYRYKFDFEYNAMGGPRTDSALSEPFTLRILDK